jgi:hypothetical protein
MPDIATTRGQPVYRPPASPIGDAINRHREAMHAIYVKHRAELAAILASELPVRVGTQVLPRRKQRAA